MIQELKLPKNNIDIAKISQEEWDKFQKDLKIAKFKLQEINDNLEGGLTSRNLASFRNTYVINAQDSLDSSYPMYVHFNILDEMIKIVSVKIDFWILNYRAYSTAATEKEAVTSGASSAESSASGGGETPTSGGCGVEFLGSRASYTTIDGHTAWIYDEAGDWFVLTHASVNAYEAHTHTVIIAAHTHNIPHTHTIPAHSHDITYGIHEEDTSPTIKFYVSENAGVSYSDVYGGYIIDKSGLDITSLLTKSGSKLIRFTSDVRARLSVQIEIKLDIKAR